MGTSSMGSFFSLSREGICLSWFEVISRLSKTPSTALSKTPKSLPNRLGPDIKDWMVAVPGFHAKPSFCLSDPCSLQQHKDGRLRFRAKPLRIAPHNQSRESGKFNSFASESRKVNSEKGGLLPADRALITRSLETFEAEAEMSTRIA